MPNLPYLPKVNTEEEKFEAIRRWRLVLGQAADPEEEEKLSEEDTGKDDVLEALYDSQKEGSLGDSSPNVNRWLGDIRKYFPSQVVQVMQKDALERLGLYQMLVEPELLKTLEVNVHLVASLLALQEIIPDKTRETARSVVRKLTEQLIKKLKEPIRQSVRGAIDKSTRNRRPRYREIDWNKTILKNLKHYQEEHKTIIPESLIGYGHRRSGLKHVILIVDQSGSMAGSVVYASIIASILAGIPSLTTRFILFDTAVADLTDRMEDPVDLMFGSQLGGGTDINQALAYAEKFIQRPSDTILFLISDLYEGGDEEALLARIKKIMTNKVHFIPLLALSDEGTPDYDKEMTARLNKLGATCFACSPDLFPDLIATAIHKAPLGPWLSKQGLAKK